MINIIISANDFYHLSQREVLGEVCPLDAPFRVQISPCENCNFRCVYCVQAVEPRGRQTLLDMEINVKIVDQMKKFPVPPKRILLNGMGEPLLNKRLPDMVAHMKSKMPESGISLTTNGSLLTPVLSKKLVESGLDQILISLQGLTTEKYKEVCGVALDFEAFVENIRYLYSIKQELKVFVKVPNIAIDESDVSHYHELFDPITDGATIEQILPLFSEVDYSKFNIAENTTSNKIGSDFGEQKICAQPFYNLSVLPDGTVFPCCNTVSPLHALGNINTQDLLDIWNGKRRTGFLRRMLKKESIPGCDDCTVKTALVKTKEDILEPYAEAVLQRINTMEQRNGQGSNLHSSL